MPRRGAPITHGTFAAAPVSTACEFERQLAALELPPDNLDGEASERQKALASWMASQALKNWCKRHAKENYIPEQLLNCLHLGSEAEEMRRRKRPRAKFQSRHRRAIEMILLKNVAPRTALLSCGFSQQYATSDNSAAAILETRAFRSAIRTVLESLRMSQWTWERCRRFWFDRTAPQLAFSFLWENQCTNPARQNVESSKPLPMDSESSITAEAEREPCA